MQHLLLLKFFHASFSIVQGKGHLLKLKVLGVRLDLDLGEFLSDAIECLLDVLLFLSILIHHVKIGL